MTHRRTLSTLALAALLAVALPVGASESSRPPEHAPNFLAQALGALGQWLDHLLDFAPAAATTQGAGCGEAGAHIDPNGCPTATATPPGEAGPHIDPDGR